MPTVQLNNCENLHYESECHHKIGKNAWAHKNITQLNGFFHLGMHKVIVFITIELYKYI